DFLRKGYAGVLVRGDQISVWTDAWILGVVDHKSAPFVRKMWKEYYVYPSQLINMKTGWYGAEKPQETIQGIKNKPPVRRIGIERWRPPELMHVKINFDAAYQQQNKK
ncbi:hypothetical protein Goarm_013329, partial [Gossypium armourianum]|nr:hypothetical protein [Gossypium armourianum]